MQAHVLTGSKQEIAQNLAQLPGEVREAIVFIDEPVPLAHEGQSADIDLFAEMRPFMVEAQEVDDSREAIYTRMEGE